MVSIWNARFRKPYVFIRNTSKKYIALNQATMEKLERLYVLQQLSLPTTLQRTIWQMVASSWKKLVLVNTIGKFDQYRNNYRIRWSPDSNSIMYCADNWFECHDIHVESTVNKGFQVIKPMGQNCDWLSPSRFLYYEAGMTQNFLYTRTEEKGLKVLDKHNLPTMKESAHSQSLHTIQTSNIEALSVNVKYGLIAAVSTISEDARKLLLYSFSLDPFNFILVHTITLPESIYDTKSMVSWHPDGEILAAGSDCHISFFTCDGTELHELHEQPLETNSFQWVPSHSHFYSKYSYTILTISSSIGFFSIYGKKIHEIDLANYIWCYAHHPTQQLLVASISIKNQQKSQIVLLDWKGTFLYKFNATRFSERPVQWSPCGTYLTICENNNRTRFYKSK